MIATGSPRTGSRPICIAIIVASALLGLGLMADSAVSTSATYDEVAYMNVAARWWRTGRQDRITRMGSPLLFWKLQQAPVLWLIDRAGMATTLDDPEPHQRVLLPLLRLAALPLWLVAFAVTTRWASEAHGPRAGAFAACLFSLSPNLLAHGPLITMETPLVAGTAALFFAFWRFLRDGRRRDFAIAAVIAGVAWSCKYTTIFFPPILALSWWLQRCRRREGPPPTLARRVAVSMIGFTAIMAATNLIVTGFRMTPLSDKTTPLPGLVRRLPPAMGGWLVRVLETPIPAEITGFVTQLNHQREGGSSYLMGEVRERGWRHYYFVCLAVKVPLSFWLLVAARALLARKRPSPDPDRLLPLAIALFLGITALGSSRNYGIRYLLPMAPLAIVWVSALAEAAPRFRWIAVAGLVGQAVAVATIHPHELAYFSAPCGGPRGGRRILADSNLDWGQGLKGLVRLQHARPEFRELTLYYFGDTDPKYYGVAGTCYILNAVGPFPRLPPRPTASTRYVAVSSSLQYGPWGPRGYFRILDGKPPAFLLEDATIAIYHSEDLGPP